MEALLRQNVASSVRSLAQSMLGDKLKIRKQKEKVDEESAILFDMEESLRATDDLIKSKTGGYGFEDLFMIVTIEKENDNGKITKSNKIAWRFPETYLPSPSSTEESQVKETEEIKETENENEFKF